MSMTLRQIAGLALALIGAWLFWGGLSPVLIIMQRGSSLSAALFEPPSSIIRLVAAAFLVLGGALVALNKRRGAALSGLGALIWVALTALMAGMGADIGLWGDEAIYALIIAALFIFIALRKRALI